MIIPKSEPRAEADKSNESKSGIGFSLKDVQVNKVPIPEKQILEEAQNHPAATPGRALRAAAEALVIRELLWQEACRLDISAAQEVDEEGRKETEIDAAIRVLIDQEVTVPTAKVDECRLYYERHPEKFNSPTLYEARHILIAVPESNKEGRQKSRARAEELCRMLKHKPELFSALAREHSDCTSSDQGGNLGQLTPGSTVEDFERAIKGMRAGEITESPVESRFGYHVIALDRIIEGHSLPFEMVNDRIAAWLEASTWSKAVSQYIAILIGQADIRGISLDGAQSPLVQ
ncbi:MAG: peptidylprolyl isomerase [Rhodobacteraceae bacterium]|nr:peptidylprolyl isomerase [Paracoccaceae bacterium]